MTREEMEFLPAALEIQERPPTPHARAILWTIVALLLLALLWACLSEVDIVAVGQGKIVPVGKSKTVQPMEIGVVKTIHVTDGQSVKAGDPLISLDPTQAQADRERLVRELGKVRLDAARARALVQRLESCATTPLRDDCLAVPSLVVADSQSNDAVAKAIQEQMLHAQWEEYRGKHESMTQVLKQRRAEAKVSEATLEKLTQTLPLVAERAKALKDLSARKLASHHEALTLEQQRIDIELSLKAEKARGPQLEAAIREAEQQLLNLDSETLRSTLTERMEAERQVTALVQELAKAEQRQQLQTLVSPIDGVVQQLAVTTIGGVVTPAQALLVVVPRDQRYEVEVYFENKDMGFIREGQEAEIKVDAFPFTQYGVLLGRLSVLSNDAIADERRGLLFPARVQLTGDVLEKNRLGAGVSAGMSVVAELKTGRRTLIAYLLDPVSQAMTESLRER